MAPIKFEEHIKDKLENRAIQPSKQAWNKLSKRLETEEKSKNKATYLWLGVAASIVGVLFIVSQFSNNNINIEVSPKIVETEEIILQDSIIQVVEESILEEAILVKGFNENKNAENDNKKVTPIKLKEENTLNINSVKEMVTVISSEEIRKQEKDIVKKPVEILNEKLSFEDQQINNIVAKVESLKNDNKTITEDDIDALLFQAQKEIRLNNLINETTGVVDANALLQDVEADLDQSFRNKVIEALKSSYNSVKTAVAQRNN